MMKNEDAINMLDFAKQVLEYYANENNYKKIDNGEQARNAIKIINQTLESFEKIEMFDGNKLIKISDYE